MRYTKEEIDGMGDIAAYRRYFAAVAVLQEMSGTQTSNPPPLGGGPPPTQTRPRRASSRSSSPTSAPGRTAAQDKTASTYNFPK